MNSANFQVSMPQLKYCPSFRALDFQSCSERVNLGLTSVTAGMIRMAAMGTQRRRSLQAFWTKRVANFLVGRLNTAPSIPHGTLFIAREN
jgi:hypothetical protein